MMFSVVLKMIVLLTLVVSVFGVSIQRLFSSEPPAMSENKPQGKDNFFSQLVDSGVELDPAPFEVVYQVWNNILTDDLKTR